MVAFLSAGISTYQQTDPCYDKRVNWMLNWYITVDLLQLATVGNKSFSQRAS